MLAVCVTEGIQHKNRLASRRVWRLHFQPACPIASEEVAGGTRYVTHIAEPTTTVEVVSGEALLRPEAAE